MDMKSVVNRLLGITLSILFVGTKKIIIEIDGGQHNKLENIEYDKKRTAYLEKKGYKIIRFWNDEITKNIEGVYKKLQEEFGIFD